METILTGKQVCKHVCAVGKRYIKNEWKNTFF